MNKIKVKKVNEIIQRFSSVKQNEEEQVISFSIVLLRRCFPGNDYLISIEKKENVSQMFDNND